MSVELLVGRLMDRGSIPLVSIVSEYWFVSNAMNTVETGLWRFCLWLNCVVEDPSRTFSAQTVSRTGTKYLLFNYEDFMIARTSL